MAHLEIPGILPQPSILSGGYWEQGGNAEKGLSSQSGGEQNQGNRSRDIEIQTTRYREAFPDHEG